MPDEGMFYDRGVPGGGELGPSPAIAANVSRIFGNIPAGGRKFRKPPSWSC